ncbi:MAG: hypothetical protein ACFCUW_12495 [Kiloniellaceae bacterium]
MAPETPHPKFEDVYPRHEFASLVRITLKAAVGIKSLFGDKPHRASGGRPGELVPPHT